MFSTIQSDVIYFLTEYWGQAFAYATIMGGLLLLCRWLCFRWKKLSVPSLQRRHCYKAVLWYLFLFYLYMLAAVTILSRTPSLEAYCNWQIFSTFGAGDWQRIFIYENILLFVPLGLLTYLLFPRVRRLYRAWLLGLCFSLLIEITQYKTHLGLFQVDDMYNNVIGMTIGYGLGEMIISFCRWFFRILDSRGGT